MGPGDRRMVSLHNSRILAIKWDEWNDEWNVCKGSRATFKMVFGFLCAQLMERRYRIQVGRNGYGLTPVKMHTLPRGWLAWMIWNEQQFLLMISITFFFMLIYWVWILLWHRRLATPLINGCFFGVDWQDFGCSWSPDFYVFNWIFVLNFFRKISNRKTNGFFTIAFAHVCFDYGMESNFL